MDVAGPAPPACTRFSARPLRRPPRGRLRPRAQPGRTAGMTTRSPAGTSATAGTVASAHRAARLQGPLRADGGRGQGHPRRGRLHRRLPPDERARRRLRDGTSGDRTATGVATTWRVSTSTTTCWSTPAATPRTCRGTYADLAGWPLPCVAFALVAMPGNVMLFCRVDRPLPDRGHAGRAPRAAGLLVAGFSLDRREGALTLPEYDACCAAVGPRAGGALSPPGPAIRTTVATTPSAWHRLT